VLLTRAVLAGPDAEMGAGRRAAVRPSRASGGPGQQLLDANDDILHTAGGDAIAVLAEHGYVISP